MFTAAGYFERALLYSLPSALMARRVASAAASVFID